MLSLWHVAAGLPVGDFPQETQELLLANGYKGDKVNRVAIVGNHFSPSGVTKADGTQVNTPSGASLPGSSAAPKGSPSLRRQTVTGPIPGMVCTTC